MATGVWLTMQARAQLSSVVVVPHAGHLGGIEDQHVRQTEGERRADDNEGHAIASELGDLCGWQLVQDVLERTPVVLHGVRQGRTVDRNTHRPQQLLRQHAALDFEANRQGLGGDTAERMRHLAACSLTGIARPRTAAAAGPCGRGLCLIMNRRMDLQADEVTWAEQVQCMLDPVDALLRRSLLDELLDLSFWGHEEAIFATQSRSRLEGRQRLAREDRPHRNVGAPGAQRDLPGTSVRHSELMRAHPHGHDVVLVADVLPDALLVEQVAVLVQEEVRHVLFDVPHHDHERDSSLAKAGFAMSHRTVIRTR